MVLNSTCCVMVNSQGADPSCKKPFSTLYDHMQSTSVDVVVGGFRSSAKAISPMNQLEDVGQRGFWA